MRLQKRGFSLLEVLIALLIISVALPILMSPFVYASIDQREAIKKMQQEKMVFNQLTTVLANMQMGLIPLNLLESNQEYPLNDALGGSYHFKKLKSGEQIELWQLVFTFKEGNPFTFNFIVKKHANTQET